MFSVSLHSSTHRTIILLPLVVFASHLKVSADAYKWIKTVSGTQIQHIKMRALLDVLIKEKNTFKVLRGKCFELRILYPNSHSIHQEGEKTVLLGI